MSKPIRAILHGSFRKHFDLIQDTHRFFTEAGIEVPAPKVSETVGVRDGFALLENEEGMDPRLIELIYLQNLVNIGREGFSYFVNPDGYIGKSAAYELGIAQAINLPIFFLARPGDHPVYIHANSVWTPQDLAAYIAETGELPKPKVRRSERKLQRLWENLVVPGSIVATGGIIEHVPRRKRSEKEVLLVRTHKWGDRWSVVGGRVKRGETLSEALLREIREETGLRAVQGEHLCTFDQFKNSGHLR